MPPQTQTDVTNHCTFASPFLSFLKPSGLRPQARFGEEGSGPSWSLASLQGMGISLPLLSSSNLLVPLSHPSPTAPQPTPLFFFAYPLSISVINFLMLLLFSQ